MSDFRFKPVRGTDEQIQGCRYTEGAVYFTTDTHKIYCDMDNKRSPMGGNSGIFYGSMTPGEDVDTDQVEFDFTMEEIEGDQKPNIDDLILNSDGCFYRVTGRGEGDEPIISTIKLTIAGSGSASGPSGPTAARVIVKDIDNKPTRYFTLDTKSASLYFSAISSITEDNFITSITYKIGNVETVVDTTPRDFGVIEFDLMPYLSKLSTSTQTTLEIRVEDSWGTKGSYKYYINVVELALTSAKKDKILFCDTGSYYFQCIPSGGTKLKNRKLTFSIYDTIGNLLDTQEQPVTSSGIEVSKSITLSEYDHGVYRMEVQLVGTTQDDSMNIYSNILSYQIINYSKEVNTALLAAHIDSKIIEQYSTLEIPYMVADDAEGSSLTKIVALSNNGVVKEQTVVINKVQTWRIYFDQPGSYRLIINCGDLEFDFDVITVVPYEGDMPVIDTTMESLKMLMSTANRSNSEVEESRKIWENSMGEGRAVLNDFYWGNTNGWMYDEQDVGMLHLTAGANLTIDGFRPFKNNATEYGLTIELDFKVSGVLDYSKPLITCLSMNGTQIQTGFQVTGQESTMNSEQITATGGVIIEGDDAQNQIYNTAIQGMTSKFTEDERIHLTWVIERETNNSIVRPLVLTYLNGVISGMTQYTSGDNFKDLNAAPAQISISSEYADIDIYNIRIYSAALDKRTVLNNYMATLGTVDERLDAYNKNLVIDDIGDISLEMIEAEGFALDTPYVKLTGGSSLKKWDVTNVTEDGQLVYRLPQTKKDYRLMKFEFINQKDPSKNFTENIQLKNPATGDVVTHPTQAAAGWKVSEGCQVYGQGTSSMEYPVKNLRIKFKKNEVQVYPGACPVDLICFKADYMESSGSHNTGTANLIYDIYSRLGLKTPAQKHFIADNGWNYDIVTAIRGFPIPVFWSVTGEPGTYEFIGKYNFNLDKATPEPFGFMHDEERGFGFEEGYKEVNIVSEDSFDNYPFDLFTLEGSTYKKASAYDSTKTYYSIKNNIHCFEFLNNAANLDNFLADEGETFEETFYKIVESDGEQVPNWYTCFESRYPEFEDYQSTEIDGWFRLCNWIASTKDNPQKFKEEFDQYLDFNFTCFYYVITHVLLMIDSRAKNAFLATWDNRKWYPIMYDMDTMLGLNNYGYNKFNYDAEDTEAGLYNGQASILWNNFREAFKEEIAEFYSNMRTLGGLTYNELIHRYNTVQADAWNEAICNADAYYKYVRPFTEGYVNSVTGEEVWVNPGSTNYLYAGQGRRSMHRQWWLSNRLNYFDGKYLAETYKFDRFVMRLYTPGVAGDAYVEIGTLAEDIFLASPSDYFYKDGNSYIPCGPDDYAENRVYYKANENVGDKIGNSASHVAPNSDFVLTPLQNQYLSIAYGGDNGQTVGPTLVKANTPQLMKAPPGAAYNDTETYIYGGSMLKDLGDLSTQYMGKFQFPDKVCKLERLVIGNPNNNYYNPNFSSLSIGAAAPYLNHINIMNCNGLSGLDLGECKRIQTILATGSALKNVLLPEYGILEELRLPATLNTLKIIDHVNLTDDKFTVGTCDYDPATDTYNYTNDFKNISRLMIVNTPIDSHKIVAESEQLAFYKLTDVDWTITSNSFTNNTITEIDVVEKLMKLQPAVDDESPSNSLTGTIKIAVPGKKVKAIDIYNKYWSTYPALYFEYDTSVMGEVEETAKIKFLDGANQVYWSREIAPGEKITDEFLSTGPNGAWKLPTKASTASHTYEFTNRWTRTEDSKTYTTDEIKTLAVVEGATYTFAPIFDENWKMYEIYFYDADEKLMDGYPIEIQYGLPIPEPELIPYKDDSKLPLEKRYGFKGYTLKNSTAIIDLTSVKTAQNYHLYSYFEEESVYDSVTNLAYFEIGPGYDYEDTDNPGYNTLGANSCTLKVKTGVKLSGKVTLPSYYEGKPITYIYNGGFTSQDEITHIFWYKGDGEPQLRQIEDSAFGSCRKLIHFEFPASLRRINQYAFVGCAALQNNILGQNLLYIGNNAFNQAFALASGATRLNLQIGESVKIIDMNAFSYLNVPLGTVTIGAPDNGSKLTSIGMGAFDQNGTYMADKIMIYAPADKVSQFEQWKATGGYFTAKEVSIVGI